MFQLNFKIALRNIWKNKSSSIINIIGLSTGLAASLLLMVYVSYEWGFDKQSKYHADVYAAMTNVADENGNIRATFNGTSTGLAELLKEGVSDVQYISRMNYGSKKLIANGQNSFKKMAKFAEPGLFKMYDYTFLAGQPNTALTQPNSVVLTESMARLLFGTSDALNKPVKVEGNYSLAVTGIIKDLPQNSSNRFDFLMPWSLYGSFNPDAKGIHWDNYSFITLIRLKENADLALVNKKIALLVNSHLKKDTSYPAHFLYPMARLRLFGSFEKGINTGGEIEQIRLLIGLAAGILLIACINFMNMSTAKSEKRAKEVGVKKAIGACRSSLVSQFLAESFILCLIAFIFSVAIVELSLPAFNHMLNISATLDYSNPWIWAGLPLLILLTGLIAGSYPALYLSSFSPLQALKKLSAPRKRFSFGIRQLLIVSQFVFAILLVISTLVVHHQLRFIADRPIGAAVNVLAEMPQDGNLIKKFDLFKEKLLNSGAVTSVTQASERLVHQGSFIKGVEWNGMRPSDKETLFNSVMTTYDYIKTTGIKLRSGKDFSPQHPSDTTSVLISNSAAKTFGIKEPIGQTISIAGVKRIIIGIFEDYVWDSPYRSGVPMIIGFDPKATGTIILRFASTNSLAGSSELVGNIAKEINPDYPTEIEFADRPYLDLMEKEIRLGTLANVFGGLSMLISCLGLYALVAYSAEQRTKEFAIRKVLGANPYQLLGLISASFMRLILSAICIAVPIGYYIMDKWMSSFEYQAGVTWWTIATAIIGITFVAMATVCVQAYKNTIASPLQALKHE